MVTSAPDRRAVEILMSTYWSPAGWRKDRSTSLDDYAYALSAGVMFEPRRISHDEAVSRAIRAAAALTPDQVASAFLASLSSRRLDLRSALGSFAIARTLPDHEAPECGPCDICGEYESREMQDLSVLNFERIKWGGVRHASPIYMALDLELFTQLPRVKPTAEDVRVFRSILSVASSLPAAARVRDLEKGIAGAIKSNKAERETLLTILGNASVLEPKEHPGYLADFIEVRDRHLPPASKLDWNYPIAWWRGSDGYNLHAEKYWFSSAMRDAA